MVAITIDLWSLGLVEKTKSLVVIAIWEECKQRCYEYRISHQFDTLDAKQASESTKIKTPSALDLRLEENEPWVWKSGRVKKCRQKKSPASLLAAVLKNAKL